MVNLPVRGVGPDLSSRNILSSWLLDMFFLVLCYIHTIYYLFLARILHHIAVTVDRVGVSNNAVMG